MTAAESKHSAGPPVSSCASRPKPAPVSLVGGGLSNPFQLQKSPACRPFLFEIAFSCDTIVAVVSRMLRRLYGFSVYLEGAPAGNKHQYVQVKFQRRRLASDAP